MRHGDLRGRMSFSIIELGARLGVSEHFADNAKVFNFRLTPQDRADIEAVLAHSNSRRMITSIGDCGAEYRA
jgi:hypothetical protein